MMRRSFGGFAAAGLFAGAAAWAVHQQAGIVLASWNCSAAPAGIKAGGIAAAIVLLIGAMLSGLALHRMRGNPDDGAPRRFLADIGLMAAAPFFSSRCSCRFALRFSCRDAWDDRSALGVGSFCGFAPGAIAASL